MPIKPSNIWSSSYESKLKDTLGKATDASSASLLAQDFWRSWVFENSQGLACTVPSFNTSATFNKEAFNPLVFPPAGAPPVIAGILVSAWTSYMTAATWTPIATPPPGWSAVVSVVTSPTGLAAASATLLAALTAEFAIVTPEPTLKYQMIGNAFYTATISCGIMVTGFLTGGPPPPPIVIPFLPAT